LKLKFTRNVLQIIPRTLGIAGHLGDTSSYELLQEIRHSALGSDLIIMIDVSFMKHTEGTYNYICVAVSQREHDTGRDKQTFE
jgi:hypothetical protein